MQGAIVSILIGEAEGGDLVEVDQAELVAEKGIRGDRHFGQDPERAVTLIEEEAVNDAGKELGIVLTPTMVRRNLVTRGVRLNDLVGKTFTVSGLRLYGTDFCHPCRYLGGRLAGERSIPEIVKALANRGGLTVRVLDSGSVAVGDKLTVPESK